MKNPEKVGDKCRYINPVAGDAPLYTVLQIEPTQNWCLIEAQVPMNIKPTETANITDLCVC